MTLGDRVKAVRQNAGLSQPCRILLCVLSGSAGHCPADGRAGAGRTAQSVTRRAERNQGLRRAAKLTQKQLADAAGLDIRNL